MIKSFLKISVLGLLATAIAGLPLQSLAQSTNKPAIEKNASAEKKKSAHPFKGTLAAVDKTAKSIQVGKTTYQITSGTKITKAGKPATLEEGVVGEEVTGYVKPGERGKMTATTVHFGPKAEGKSAEKKKEN